MLCCAVLCCDVSSVAHKQQSVAAKQEVLDQMGADHLGLRTTKWANSTYVEQNKHFKPKAIKSLLSTTHGPDGPSDANHKATAAALLKTDTSTSIAFGKKGTTGDWASSTYVAPGQMKESLRTTREASLKHTAKATPALLQLTTAKNNGGKKASYKPPWKVQEEKMATMRSLKASGQWPEPPPKQEVLACTARAKTRPRDLQDVLDLDTFRPPGMEDENY